MLPITLAILAGGEGARMGKPKSLLTLHDKPILQFLLDQFVWPGPTLLVTAPGREHPPGHHLFDQEAIDATNTEGPLRGILTALEQSNTDLVVVTTVDMPNIMPVQFHWLANQLQNEQESLALMTQRSPLDPRSTEPFPSAFRTAAAPVIRARLTNNQRSVQALTQEPNFQLIPAPIDWPPSTWTNLNHPDDYEAFLKLPS